MNGTRAVGVSSRGFTFVEMLVAVLLCGLVLGSAHSIFSQGVRSSVKGMDLLESIRAANEVFSQIRKDLRASIKADTSSPKLVIPMGELNFPDLTPVLSDTLVFQQTSGTATYSLVSGSDGQFIRREEVIGGAVTSVRKFAVPRIKSFKTTKIGQKQRVAEGYDVFIQDQLFVQISVESNDPRFPGEKVDLSNFFVTGQLVQTAWWNNFYDSL